MKYRMLITIICIALSIAALTSFAAQAKPVLKIHVSGLSDDIKENTSLTLDNIAAKLKRPLTTNAVRNFSDRAPLFIKRATAPYGYFDPAVTKSLTRDDSGWHLTFHVKQGKPVIISSISVIVTGDGKNAPYFKKYLLSLPLKKGDILNTAAYSQIKSALYNLGARYGYFDADMEKSEIKINRIAHTAHITIIFNSKRRYRFGKVTFSKTNFQPRFLHHFITFKAGEPYDVKKIEGIQQTLVGASYFTQVLVKPLPKKAKNYRVPIHISLIMRKKKTYTLGAGYGSDTGIRGTAGFDLRHMGSWGQQLKMFLRASQDNSKFTAKYLIPGRNPAKDLYTISSGYTKYDQLNAAARNMNFSVNYTHKFGNWIAGLSLTYLKERYRLLNTPNTQTSLVYPTASIRYNNADHPLNPVSGVSFAAYVAGARKSLLSKTDFLQITTQLSALYTINPTHTRLLFRTAAGYTNIKDLDNLPLSLQLYAGGARSVRGYSYNELGPGRQLLVLSGEVQQRIYKQWYLAFFTDAGAVGDQYVLSNIHIGVGPAIAWVSSIGTIELSVANAITEKNKPWKIQFSMGSAL